MDLTAPLSPGATDIVKPTHPSACDMNVLDTAGVMLESRTDRWIKVVKELGFPAAVAGFLLVILSGLVKDFRDGLKATNESGRITAVAVSELSKTAEKLAMTAQQHAMAQERLTQAFGRFETNQLDHQTILRVLVDEQKRTNSLLRSKGLHPDGDDGG